MLRRALFLTSSVLIGSLIGGAAWLGSSERGLQTAVQLANQATAGQLQITEASGTLLGPLDIVSLRWETPDLQIQAEQIHLDWTPTRLFRSGLQITELSLAKLHIASVAQSTPSPAPTSLLLPLTVDVKKLLISRLEYGNTFAAEGISGRLSSDGRHHKLTEFQAETSGASLLGEATLDGAAPLPLAASAKITGQLENHPLVLRLNASGPLERIALAASAEEGITGQAQVELTPFAPASFASAHLALDHIDPAAWQVGAPSAQMNLRADLAPKGNGVAGDFTLHNTQPGTLDRQHLPFTQLTGRLDWQDATAKLDNLQAILAGRGELNGSGEWQNGTLLLELAASRLDAAKIVSSLRSTTLNGPISARLDANQQSVKLNLKDSRFTVIAEASHAGEKVTLAKLEISSGKARLAAKGELGLDKGMAFKAAGELSRFDPSQFAQVPAALINAQLTAQGRLEPRPIIVGQFVLHDSQVAGQALAGRGQLNIDWPRIPLADIQLSAGLNKLNAQGAFGRPGDKLAIVIEAPQLSPFGLEGGISGHFDLAGGVQQPKISGQLQAAKLGLPGQGQLSGLLLKANIGGEANAPLLIDLSIDQLGTSELPELAQGLRIHAEGTNQAHRWQSQVDFPGNTRLTLVAEGGLFPEAGTQGWRGRLLAAQLNGEEKMRNFHLAAPAVLKLGAPGWTIGPAQLVGESLVWQATVQAAADTQHLQASVHGHGKRIGQVDGELNASMLGPWSLNSTAPWQARLKTDTPDLGWMTEFLGEAWQTEGRFFGELMVTGTPARPIASGRFRGEKMAVRLPEQGLNLANGEMVIDLDNNFLRVSKMGFDSVHQPIPRTLRLGARDEIAALTAKPGRLEISGEMAVDRSKGPGNAFLDIHLDRLGAWQLPDQWILLSGAGRLTMQGDTFGAKGQLAVDAGYWQLAASGNPRLSDDVIVTRPGKEKSVNNLRPKLDLDITTDLGKNFLFTGAGLSSRLVGDIRLRASGRDLPRASGNIRARDGRFNAYGQQLDIERGILTFQGLLDNPALDVRAVRKGLPVEAGVQISGTAQKPVIKLISDPELPEAEKLAWLVLGHGPEQMGAGDATVLLSAAGGLLGNNSGNVIQELKKNFGIDEFGVRQGNIDGSGGRQPTSRVVGSSTDTTAATGNQIFSVGKRLSSNALLSYEQTLGKAEGIVKLTVNLTRQISIVGRAGSDNALDIFYAISFGKPPRPPRVDPVRKD